MEPEELGDDEWVSQRVYLKDGQQVVRNRPRPRDREKLSVIRGRVTAEEALRAVRTSSRHIPPCGDDGVRYALVSDLREAGFVVEHTPNKRNSDHVSVVHSSRWDDQVSAKFHQCFSDILWHHEEEGGQHDENSP